MPRRDKFKFPGGQRMCISKNQGFTKFNIDALEDTVPKKWLFFYGGGVKHSLNCGLLDMWWVLRS